MNIIALIVLILAFLLFVFAARWRPATPTAWNWHLGWSACALVTAVAIWYTHLWSVAPVH